MTIYQEIWESDENRMSIGTRVAEGWSNPEADILLDEQVRSSGSRQRDLAANPLFARVNAEKLERPTYRAFRRLLDNYVVNFRDPEETTDQERSEIDAFLQAACETEPMKIAHAYLRDDLGLSLSDAELQERLRHIWFESYTNYYAGRSTHFASGFEHVFVGEGKYNARHGIAESKGEISGYHSWLKFALDEQAGRVNYLGYKYDLNGDQGPDNPHVVTLQMIWNHVDMGGRLRAQLFKKKGGFFVGSSPECELALGTVAFFENSAGRYRNDRRLVEIAGGRFNLVMYRNIRRDGQRGSRIRSFYPEYLGLASRVDTAPIDRTVTVPVLHRDLNEGPIRIVSALPNPTGNEELEESVTLRNVGEESVSLVGWELRDAIGRPFELTGDLQAGEAKTFSTRTGSNGMQMRNRASFITLHDGSTLVAVVHYERPSSGEKIEFIQEEAA
ncbi:MAG: endoribonuclease [Deltaproteobacteria bacterium]